jgi:hypothetical protein
MSIPIMENQIVTPSDICSNLDSLVISSPSLPSTKDGQSLSTNNGINNSSTLLIPPSTTTSNPATKPNWKRAWGWLELQAEQRSRPWFDARRCCATGSVAKKAMGWSSETYDPKDKVVNEICGRLPPTIVNTDMQRGIDNEDPLRKLFMTKVLSHLGCYEPSLCMGLTVYDFPLTKNGKLLSEVYGSMETNPYHPQWFIGASPDGIILDSNGYPTADLECKVMGKSFPMSTGCHASLTTCSVKRRLKMLETMSIQTTTFVFIHL